MSLYLLIVTIVVPDVTIFIYLLSVRDLTSIFEVPYIIYNVQFLSSSYMKTSLFWTAATTLLTIGSASAAVTTSKADKSASKTRPNILFCIADDASYRHFGANGSSWVKTPGFDRVAEAGILFTNCYTPNAKSAPSRSCILTGLYSWQLGAAGNHTPIFPDDLKVVTEALEENGYQVAFTGKGWGPGDAGVKNGAPRKLTGTPYLKHKLTPLTTGINKVDYFRNFQDFLQEKEENQPWFFWFGCFEPHRNYEYGSGERLGGKDKTVIDDLPPFWPDNDVVRTDMLDYAFEVEYYDNLVNRFLDELEKRGELDNTIIIVTSDNGMPFPRSKGNNYEYSNHMPLAVMWKNGIANPGRKVSDYVSFVDFVPTFLEVSDIGVQQSGLIPPAGKSMVDIFKTSKAGIVSKDRHCTLLGRERHDYGRPLNQGYPIRSILQNDLLYVTNLKPELYPCGNPETGYTDCDGSPTKTEILRMKRSGENSYYYDITFDFRPEEELYDLSVDKDCMNNLAGNEKYAKIKKAMRQLLFDELRAQKDPRLVGDGDTFDRYPFWKKNSNDFYERVQSGEIKEPWKMSGFVSPTDFENHPDNK